MSRFDLFFVLQDSIASGTKDKDIAEHIVNEHRGVRRRNLANICDFVAERYFHMFLFTGKVSMTYLDTVL